MSKIIRAQQVLNELTTISALAKLTVHLVVVENKLRWITSDERLFMYDDYAKAYEHEMKYLSEEIEDTYEFVEEQPSEN